MVWSQPEILQTVSLKNKNENRQIYCQTWLKIKVQEQLTIQGQLAGRRAWTAVQGYVTLLPKLFLPSSPVFCQGRPCDQCGSNPGSSPSVRLTHSAGDRCPWGQLGHDPQRPLVRTLTQCFCFSPEGYWLYPLQCQHAIHDTCDWSATTREHPAHLSEQQCAHQAHCR